MKKLVLTIGCSAAVALSALAQGDVNWSGPSTFFVAQTNGTVYSSFETSSGTPQGTQGNTVGNTTAFYYYALLENVSGTASPTTVSQLAAWTYTGLNATNGPGANGRIVTENNPTGTAYTQAPATGTTSGTAANFIIVGWSANLGTNFATVLNVLQNWGADQIANAYFGVSAEGLITPNSANPGTTVFGSGAGQINNPSASPVQLDLLGTVPEPGTMALAALGGASLLLFRRRKAS